MFKTNRLVLRAYDPAQDDAVMLECWNDLELQRATRAEFIIPLGKPFLDTIHGWVANALIWVTIVEATSGQVVGNCALWHDGPAKNRDPQLGITIAKPFWDKGYGTEVMAWARDHAFNDLGMHRISLGVFGHNARAQKVYKRIGFVEEGRKRSAIWVNGKWEDVILMAITEDDWRAMKAQT